MCPKRRKIICQFSYVQSQNWLSYDKKPFFLVKKSTSFCALTGSFLIFFQKKTSDLFSAIQDTSFAILKSIFEKLLFLGSNKGRGKKKQNLHLADFKFFFFFFFY